MRCTPTVPGSAQRTALLTWQRISADGFEVTQPFLLQQAAWLYERQLSQVRAQMRKVGTTAPSASTSPAPGSISGSTVGGYAMKRGGSGGTSIVEMVCMKIAHLVQGLGYPRGFPYGRRRREIAHHFEVIPAPLERPLELVVINGPPREEYQTLMVL